ncbi:hypothetical protein PTI98_002092 [Pleurotus ostreatus]|nr:hypothetical protein PTI98_004088 [Pleurotus ostreatus]KAJ8703470.1 hypothetical protein PTI98_002092 [Pleurotus ostreatus]
MQRRKRAHMDIQVYEDWELGAGSSTPSQPPITESTTHRHVDYVARKRGISTKTSYYSTEALSTVITDDHGHDESSTYDSVWDETTGLHRIEHDRDDDEEVTCLPRTTRKRTMAGDQPLLVWMHERDTFVQEFLRLEGRAYPDAGCPGVHTELACGKDALFRCPQCFDPRLFCQDCIVLLHQALPLHVVEIWNSRFFQRCSLRSLGLRFQLGHPIGEPCLNPKPANKDEFVVISSHGIISINLDYCACLSAADTSIQLLRSRLFPATTIEPRTAATFDVLRLFQLLTFGSKVSGFEFYHSLARLTNNLGQILPDRYTAFMRIVREWRHIRLLKRAGRGHEPGGVLGTAEGSCAVLCPACPHPGKNLPPNWQAVPGQQWIYSLFLAIDANFRLKRLGASNDIRDPGLNKGYAYFVEEKKFKEFLESFDGAPPDEATCQHSRGKGTTTSGVGTIECSRHDMKRPLSVGDLQKGERYINMDYLYFSSLRNHAPQVVVTSYDIACQWSRNLQARAATYPDSLVGVQYNELSIRYLVPKFHLYAHRDDCQIKYSFNLTPKVGRTDGESPERGWAAMNPVASSTKEMGPGSRRDTLDDHFGDYNWRKVISFHTTLLRRAQEAVQMRAEHVTAFVEFSNSLPAATTRSFSELVWAWEADPTETNPYRATVETVSQAKIRLELAEEEAATIAHEDGLPAHDSVSPSVFIAQGLELEEQQARLRIDASALTANATEHQRTLIIERRNRLARRIATWRSIQDIYMPGAMAHRSTEPASILAEDDALRLPSQTPLQMPLQTTTLADYEWRLRYGQAFDSLAELRRHLLVLSSMYQSKDRYVRGQQHNTRSVALVKKVQARSNFAASKYRSGRAALLMLSPALGKSDWQSILRPLLDSDIRGLKDGEDASSSEGRRTLSWIWMAQRTNDAEMTEGMNEALRIEWCKARARAQRWQEECMLLTEEMRRVVQFHTWQAKVWEDRATASTNEGARAYAWRQESTRQTLISMCQTTWRHVDRYMRTGEGAVVPGEALIESCTPSTTS